MNPELYTDEFRNFKYLKSSSAEVSYFKTARMSANLIQPWDQELDPDFLWKTRVEFIEQLIDLRHDSVYIIFAGLTNIRDGYEDPSLITIEKPVVLGSNPILRGIRELTLEDILTTQFIEASYCLSEEKYIQGPEFDLNGRIFNLGNLPIIPFSKPDYTEMFYDKDEAEKYRSALTIMLRNKINAISSFSVRL